MVKICIIFFIIVIGVTSLCYCDEMVGGYPLQTFDGTVSSVDIGGSKLVVKGANEMTFPISPDAKFVNDAYNAEEAYDMQLSDLNEGDYVSVEYYTDAAGALKTTRVTLKTRKNDGD